MTVAARALIFLESRADDRGVCAVRAADVAAHHNVTVSRARQIIAMLVAGGQVSKISDGLYQLDRVPPKPERLAGGLGIVSTTKFVVNPRALGSNGPAYVPVSVVRMPWDEAAP